MLIQYTQHGLTPNETLAVFAMHVATSRFNEAPPVSKVDCTILSNYTTGETQDICCLAHTDSVARISATNGANVLLAVHPLLTWLHIHEESLAVVSERLFQLRTLLGDTVTTYIIPSGDFSERCRTVQNDVILYLTGVTTISEIPPITINVLNVLVSEPHASLAGLIAGYMPAVRHALQHLVITARIEVTQASASHRIAIATMSHRAINPL